MICGDIESNYDAVFTKVKNLSAKTNFNFLLCVGNFFGEFSGNLEDYKTGKKKGNWSESIKLQTIIQLFF